MNACAQVTERGFTRIEFRDVYDKECSLQESSLATDNAIWFGISEAKPEYRKDGKWVTFEYPEGVEIFTSTRMHLKQSQMHWVIPALQHFQKYGVLPDTEDNMLLIPRTRWILARMEFYSPWRCFAMGIISALLGVAFGSLCNIGVF